MADLESAGGSVTLIFRQIERQWRKEHLLNLAAAWFTGGNLSHVEIAIGTRPGSDGQQMSNVLRIYNDKIGVELCERTGRSPNYKYLQIGCSKDAEHKILNFAERQKGKPFNGWAMARSVMWPRKTTQIDYFCAELVACALKEGGLMSSDSNPGAATPQSLYNMYKAHAATTGNPYVLRTMRKTPDKPPPKRRFNDFELVPTTLSREISHAGIGVNAYLLKTKPSHDTHGTATRTYAPPAHASNHASQHGSYTPAEMVIRNATRGLCASCTSNR